MEAAISMGASLSRHPVEYLIPDGYVGWVTIMHGANAPPLEMRSGEYVCRIPSSGMFETSSKIEDGWAKDEYAYYAVDGSLRRLLETGWGKGGMIWGGSVEYEAQGGSTRPTQIDERFFVGTEQQYDRSVNDPKSTLGH